MELRGKIHQTGHFHACSVLVHALCTATCLGESFHDLAGRGERWGRKNDEDSGRKGRRDGKEEEEEDTHIPMHLQTGSPSSSSSSLAQRPQIFAHHYYMYRGGGGWAAVLYAYVYTHWERFFSRESTPRLGGRNGSF